MIWNVQCAAEIATIVAMMQVQNIFYYPTRGQESIKGIFQFHFIYAYTSLVLLRTSRYIEPLNTPSLFHPEFMGIPSSAAQLICIFLFIARVARRRFQAYQGDLVTSLNVATAYTKHCDNPRWCAVNYINKKAIKRALTLRDQLLKLLKRLGVQIRSAQSTVNSN